MEQVPIEELQKKPYILYFSHKSQPSLRLHKMINENQEISYMFDEINIDVPGNMQHNIRSVPSIIIDDTAYSGKDAFDWYEEFAKNSVNSFDAFSSGYSTSFSGIDDDMNTHSFFSMGNDSVQLDSKNLEQQDENRRIIDSLMEQRANEVPKPIQRV
jgi:hypothetical protein